MSDKITFDNRFGALVKEGNRAGIKFEDEEIKGWTKEVLEGKVAIGYPESIYTTAGKSTFIMDDYTISFWLKAQLENGKIERNVIQINRHPEDIVCVAKVDSKEDFENICNTLLVFPKDYDLDYNPNEKTLYTTAGQVVMQNIFFDDVDDALDYQKQQEEKEEAIERAPEEEIDEVDFESLLGEEFEGGGGIPPMEGEVELPAGEGEQMGGGELPPLE